MRSLAAAVLAGLVLGVGPAGSANGACNANRAWQDRYPVWSPKGDWVAFLRQLPGCDPAPQTLWMVRPNGTGARALTTVRTYLPSWSPDGRRLVFETARGVEIASIDRPGRRLLVPHGVGPMWSPVDERIAYRGAWGAVTIVNSDGTHAQTITPETIDWSQPAWSRDGSRLVYSVDRSHGNVSSYIEVVNADGSDRRRLTEPFPPNPVRQVTDRNPTWEGPFGQTIAFESNRDGNWEIYSIGADGTNLRNLTRNPAEDIRPTWWSPDRLVFISDRNEPPAPWGFRHSLYLLDVFTGVTLSLAHDVHPDSNIAWSPIVPTLAFSSGGECDRWGIYEYNAFESVRVTNRCAFDGTAHADRIVGSAFNDTLDGKGGNDRLYGGAGDDQISGGLGADRIFGGPGNDSIDGGNQRNVVFAGPGNDRIAAQNGWIDTIDCGSGRDIVGADRFDVLRHCETRY